MPRATDGSDEDPSACRDFDCAATGRVQCPSGDFCMYDYCAVCNGQNFTVCPDGSDQLPASCHLRDLSNCTYSLYGLHGPGGGPVYDIPPPQNGTGTVVSPRGAGGGYVAGNGPQEEQPGVVVAPVKKWGRRHRKGGHRRVGGHHRTGGHHLKGV